MIGVIFEAVACKDHSLQTGLYITFWQKFNPFKHDCHVHKV